MLGGVWDRIVGQDRAVQVLQRAAARPVHAYLLVGPAGSGVEEAARCFAASLVNPVGDPRTVDLVLRGMHSDVVEFEPEGASFLVHQADDVRSEVHRSPVEGERKVVVLLEADRMTDASANKLLKTIEEPPARSVVVLVTDSPEELLPTVRSRCQRVDFSPLAPDALRDGLVAAGLDPERAALAAALSGGQLARARALVGPLAALRDTFAGVPARVDGAGATAAALAAELDAVVEAAVKELADAQAREVEELEADLERHGYSDREGRRLRAKLERRHKREVTRARRDLLQEGVTAIETVYRDALGSPAPPLNADRPVLVVSPRAAAAALDACREAREAFGINEKGTLQLVRLVLSLPSAGGSRPRAR